MEQPVTLRFLQYKAIRSDLRESSVEILDRAVGWFVAVLGDLDVGEIAYTHIDDFRKWLLNGRSPRSANCYLAMMKSFFNWLARRRYIVCSPFEGIQPYKTNEKRFEIYSHEEIRRIYGVASEPWKSIVSLALCSMRVSEILNLCVSDIDFANNRIKITPKKDTAETWRWDIKNYREAYVGLDESVTKLLILRCEDLKKMPYVNLKPLYWERNLRKRDEGCLRQRQRNNPWGNFNRDWKSLLHRASVKPKRFHDLRSVFATERLNEGYDIKELQYLMRHSSIQTTAIYLRNIEEQRLCARSGETFAKHYATFNVP